MANINFAADADFHNTLIANSSQDYHYFANADSLLNWI